MEGPGISLFQGSDSIQLNTTAQRQEEDEEQEDIKRRNEEIKNILTNAFDDLDNDDEASSVNSSRCYNDVTRDSEQSRVGGSVYEATQAESGPTISQIQREFGVYGHVEGTTDRNDRGQPTFEHTESDRGPTISDIQREYGVYGHLEHTPYSKNNQNNTMDSPYEIRKPPTPKRPHIIRTQLDKEYNFPDGYPNHFNTPTNHFVRDTERYPNNGYIDDYDKNGGSNESGKEFGGGDHEPTSDHFKHCFQTSPNGIPVDDNIAYKTAEYNSKEQLEVLYSVRMREIQRLTEELQLIQEERHEETSQLSRKLALAQAEVERSNLSRNQAQNLLVDAKVEIADLQRQLTSLKDDVAVLEKTKQNMAEELSVARDSVADLQQKIAVLERVQALHSTDKTHEKFLKQAQEKHAVEMKNMQIQIDALTDKLNVKETSYVALEHKLADVRRAHETLMVEKGDTMNRLTRALDESQAQCRHLMAMNNGQEVTRLQNQLKITTEEKEELAKTVQDLQHKLELARSDINQYDSLLTTTCEEESDSMRQLKLGDLHNRSKSKPSDDITNKLRGELQRCLAGQAVKRKEINRLENTLAQKERELEKSTNLAQTCQEEAAKYARRVNELEHELKSLLTDKAMKANTEIQKLSDHLNDTKKLCDSLREEKNELENRLKEILAGNEENLKRLRLEVFEEQEKTIVGEYNKEYLEIHEKAVQRVRQEAQIEIVQLSVQLEETQKELDRVKELYVDVCGTKEQLIAQHSDEIKELKKKYADYQARESEMSKMSEDLETRISVIKKLTKECELYRSKIGELEKDLANERQRREEHTKKIYVEIERAKEEASKELRNANPEKYDVVSKDRSIRNEITEKMESQQQNKTNNSNLEEKVKLLENELRRKEEQLLRLKEIDILKEERDRLVAKLQDQARQFERYVKSQSQVSAELNVSPQSSASEADLQKMKEIAIKEVREEMEEKVTDELKGIEEQHRQRQGQIEEKYKSLLMEVQVKCREKAEEFEAAREAMIAEKLELQASFKMQEQAIAHMVKTKLEKMHQELVARKLRIEALQEEFNRREIDMEERRNVMAQVMSEWASEIRSIKAKEAEMINEIEKRKEIEQNLTTELKELKEKENEMKNSIDMLKHKYQAAKKTAENYKELAKNREKFLLSERKGMEDSYKRAMNQVHQKLEAIVTTREEQVAEKIAELERQYEEKLEQMRLKMKYKNKC